MTILPESKPIEREVFVGYSSFSSGSTSNVRIRKINLPAQISTFIERDLILNNGWVADAMHNRVKAIVTEANRVVLSGAIKSGSQVNLSALLTLPEDIKVRRTQVVQTFAWDSSGNTVKVILSVNTNGTITIADTEFNSVSLDRLFLEGISISCNFD